MRALKLLFGTTFAVMAWATSARAVTAEVPTREPSLVGATFSFRATVADAVGAAQLRWNFGDGTRTDFEIDRTAIEHTYAEPGHYAVQLTVKDDVGFTSVAFMHTVHFPIATRKPSQSASIVYDEARGRIYEVNQDNDTVSAIDPESLTKVAELAVYQRPEALAIAPEGKLWVLHRDDYAVAVVDPDRFVIERGFRLPYASQPIGLVMSPSGDAAYVTLAATDKLLKLSPTTGQVLAEVDVGFRPRGVSVSHDGKDVYVTRFISPDSHGEIARVDGATMKLVKRIDLAADTTTLDTDQQGRGLPNYLFSIGLSPDGRQAWVPAKKDNVFRGIVRDAQPLTQDNIVRPMAAILDLSQDIERLENRIDFDDRNLPSYVEFSPLGDYAFVTLTGTNRVEVRDSYSRALVTALMDAGLAPRATVLGPKNRMFVQGSLTRNVAVYDVATILDSSDPRSIKLADVPAVAQEKLEPAVLRGKQVFYDSEDKRMTVQGYVSCASCHFDGFEDGRVWDFTDRGEGLRNTPSLLGRRGMGQGPVHWSGNFDEIQDFENEIRGLFNGLGFMTDDVFAKGTVSDPLGDPKKGLSTDLDALAAFATSLGEVHPSPYRNADGTLTADAEAGKALFGKLGCDFCHMGKDFTDSARGMLHDVGTQKPSSGQRSHAPLTGIDTPTLLGIWETPPYLHDGSAATVRDVLTTSNPRDEHGFASSLAPAELDQLVAYLLQVDDGLPPRRLPFEPPLSVDGGRSDGGSNDGATTGLPVAAPAKGCACTATGRREEPGAIVALALTLVLALGRRRRRSMALVALGLSAAACSAGGPPTRHDAAAPNWSSLPPVLAPDPELARIGTRDAQYAKLCAAQHGDSFFERVCGGARPNLTSLDDLVRLVGLDEERAFALTGNSTSLVAMSVSAVNPRILLFPRVGPDLGRPDELTAIGFVRGESFVEVTSRDRKTGELAFYLLAFERSCDYDGSCDLASQVTEEIERGWTAYSIYDEAGLAKTSFDCAACHQPDGHGTRKILRMQELKSPWLHWFPQKFVRRTDSDRVLTTQFMQAHDVDRSYGGVPVSTIAADIDDGSAAQLEALVRAEGDGDQPNAFDPAIEAEAQNGGTSATWLAQFQLSLRGEAIPVPYPRADVTDLAKREAAVQSYRRVVTHAASRDTLLDPRDVFSDDALEKLGFVPQPGADGRAVLVQMCSRCHDGRADPTVGRYKFNVKKLDEMSRGEKDLAIARMQDPIATRMPPWRVARMTKESLDAAIGELSK